MTSILEKERRRSFDALVLQGLWLIIRLLVYMRKAQGGPGSGFDIGYTTWRANALGHFDAHWPPHSDEQRRYRESHAFPQVGNEP